MANLIQIKRSTTTAGPPTLANGEFGYTANGDVLFIGSNGSTVAIGGARNPGTLTANQALVANSTSYIDVIKTANLYIGTSSVNQINAIGNSTFLGAGANNELVTSYAIKNYIDLRTGANAYPQGANGAFQYNNSGALYGTNNFFYDNSVGAITVGNSSVNVQLGYFSTNNQMAHFHGNANTYVQTQFQNANTGNNASADLVINADNANDTVGFLDIGINGSGYNQAAYNINGAGDAYVYTATGGLAVGTASAKPLQFFANGTTSTNEVMRITAGANVGIGNTAPDAKLAVTGTANISGAVAIGGALTVGGVTTHNANVVLGSSGLSANGGYGSNGQVLVSNGTATYWGTGTSGSNTQIQFNDSGVANASAGFTFNKSTNTLFVGNTINVGVNTAITNASIVVGATTANQLGVYAPTVNASSFTSGSAFVANNTGVYANAVVNAAAFTTATVTANATVVAVGANNIINTTAISLSSNSTVNVVVTPTTLTFANTTGTPLVVNATGIYHTGVVNAAALNTGATGLGTGGLVANVTTLFIGNNTVNTVLNTTGLNVNATTIANTSGVYTPTANAGSFTVGSSTIANSSGVFTTGTVNGSIISVGSTFQANSTLTNAVALSTGANFLANNTGVFANTANAASFTVGSSVTTNTSGVFVANTTGTVNAATVSVGTAFIANSTKVTFTGANIDATSAVISARDVNVSGNLVVSGTLTAIDTNTLQVKDNMIKLADNQANSATYTDTVSVGFYGVYGNTANTYYAGFFRDQSISSANYSIFRTFHTHTDPGSTVDTTDATYVPGAILSWLITPKNTLVANSTNLLIQGNTGISVDIAANTLTLIQALGGTSGGTGLNSYTSQDILVANTSNGFNKLSLGTTGKVLQSNGTALVYDVLDGGSF
jgi:filamentous hemagglutinin